MTAVNFMNLMAAGLENGLLKSPYDKSMVDHINTFNRHYI